jgi:hypothetical protein
MVRVGFVFTLLLILSSLPRGAAGTNMLAPRSRYRHRSGRRGPAGVDRGGAVTLIGSTDHVAKGLVVPEPPGGLLGVLSGCLLLGVLMRRRERVRARHQLSQSR